MKIHLKRLHEGQKRVSGQATRFNVLACGRRWGKTLFGEDRVVHPALAGEPVGWFAPTYKYLDPAMRELFYILSPVTKSASLTQKRVELITGGTIEFWTLDDQDAGRSRKYRRVIIDEAAMVGDLGETWQAAIRPTLADYEGDAWALSTPKGHNFFWQMYQWGLDPEKPDWSCWSMPTSTNPHIPPAEIDEMQESMPDRIYRQEVLAEFIEDAGGVFRGVAQAATATPQEKRIPGHDYVIGVDWGKMNDFTVLTVLDTTLNECVHVDRFNKIDWQLQLSRLVSLRSRFEPYTILAEINSMGDPLIEQVRGMGMPIDGFQTTHRSKGDAIVSLANAFERGDLKIIPDPVLVSELQAYEMERLPAGTFRYNAPEGMHDDCVMSLAIAWHAATIPVIDYSQGAF